MKILIIGHGQHGKDTLAEMLIPKYQLKFKSATMYACEHIIYPLIGSNYNSMQECYDDRINCRELWKELITAYNTPIKSNLVKNVLEYSDIYVGLRDIQEYEECVEQELFDIVIGIYNPTIPLDNTFNIPLEVADILILNNRDITHLQKIVDELPNIYS
jgi:hypothetical protein